jgi:phosphatidyl-myo-inositol alpha-mannosyltransferase
MSESGLRVGLVYDDTIDRYGGIPLYVTTLGRALARRGHWVEYLVGDSAATGVDGAAVHSLARNVRVRFNGNALSMPVWTRGKELRGALEAGRYDVLHVQVPYSPLMAGRLVTRADPRCAVVGTYHVASERALPRMGARLLRILKLRSAPRFDEIVSVSRVAAEFAATCSGMEAGRIVPNMLDLGAVSSGLPGTREDPADVVFVGRLVPRKGVRQLIDAIARLDGRHERPTRVAIIGDGPLRRGLQRRVRDAGLSDRVAFLGNLDDRRKLALLSRAKIACFPSLFGESFGLVILEALAAGADAVVAGGNPGYRELLGEAGGLVDPCDTVDFASRLQQLLDDADGRQKLGDSQRRLIARYDSDLVVEAVLDVYRQALRRRRGTVVPLPRPLERTLDVAA